MLKRSRFVLLLALGLGLCGCNNPPAFPELHPLTGTLTRAGEPVTSGGLIFVPESGDGGGLTVNATVDGNGTFTARTSRIGAKNATEVKEGIPAGRYKVTYHPVSDGSKMGLEVAVEEVVTVQPGDNKVAIQLPPPVVKADEGDK